MCMYVRIYVSMYVCIYYLSIYLSICLSIYLLTIRHRGNGCVLARCSQPMLGLLGWRCQEDEKLLMALSQACISQTHSRAPPVEIMQRGGERLPLANGHTFTPPSLLILDLRSYAAALGNRAKGGGCEHPDYYSNCEIKYKGLANIHSIRKSFQSLRTLLSGGDQTRYIQLIYNYINVITDGQVHDIVQLLYMYK